jgi:hypothetical protein
MSITPGLLTWEVTAMNSQPMTVAMDFKPSHEFQPMTVAVDFKLGCCASRYFKLVL